MTTTAQSVSLPRRINFRIIVFIGVVLGLLGIPIYIWADAALSGGVKQRGDFLDVDLKAISTFEFDQKYGRIEDIPEKWRALDGKKVIMRGEMTPDGFSVQGMNQHFELVYSVSKCCMSGPIKIQHFVQAQVPQNRLDMLHRFANEWEGGAIEVRGTLTVKVTRDENDKITGVYHVLVDDVKPI